MYFAHTLPENTLHVFQSSSKPSHFTALTRNRELHHFGMNGATKKLQKMASEDFKDEVTSKLFEENFLGEEFMTSSKDCENFDKLFKNLSVLSTRFY